MPMAETGRLRKFHEVAITAIRSRFRFARGRNRLHHQDTANGIRQQLLIAVFWLGGFYGRIVTHRWVRCCAGQAGAGVEPLGFLRERCGCSCTPMSSR